uniref:ecto-ADP-ribosyltransferase 5-like n=1 Tax=Centroberyx gerrardi TaxID=166262 RepID=UPI003AB04047
MESKDKYSLLLIIIMGVLPVTEAGTKSVNFAKSATAMNKELDSVDDQYSGCEVDMLKKVIEPGGLLEKELKADQFYLEAWKNGKTCRKQIPGAQEEHNIALAVFTSDFNFYDKFNNAVRSLGSTVEIYKSDFPYKSLHFLLADALRILNKTHCYEGSSGTHLNLNMTEVNSEVRLGTYRWGSPFMERFCQTEFKVSSCLAVDVRDYSCFRDIEVVIPPHELFQVMAVDILNDGAKKVITLMSKGTYWKHKCSYLQRNGNSDGNSAHVGRSSALVLLAAPLFLLLAI